LDAGITGTHQRAFDGTVESTVGGTGILRMLSVSELAGGAGSVFCQISVEKTEVAHMKVRKKVWAVLPNVFGLKAWRFASSNTVRRIRTPNVKALVVVLVSLDKSPDLDAPIIPLNTDRTGGIGLACGGSAENSDIRIAVAHLIQSSFVISVDHIFCTILYTVQMKGNRIIRPS